MAIATTAGLRDSNFIANTRFADALEDILLLETGDQLLLEDGNDMFLEDITYRPISTIALSRNANYKAE